MTSTARPLSRSVVISGLIFCSGLVWVGLRWPQLWVISAAPAEANTAQPFLEALKLVIAALIGAFITSVHHPSDRGRKSTQPIAHAQILFCVAGALIIMVIGDSLARAFGAFGIASIIRFRTALKDPKDATVLFLLMGLGMSVGTGILALTGLGTIFIGTLLWILDRTKEEKLHEAMLELRAVGPEFPTAHVDRVLAHNHVAGEAREMEHGTEAMVRYHVLINANVVPENVSAQLVDGGRAGIKSVRWEMLKRKAD